MKALWVALQLLTRLPLPDRGAASDRQIGRSLLFYPVVGLLIGALLMLAAWLTEGAPEAVRAALLLLIWTLITGALHLDGLADSADAWIGGYGDRERTLAIMKDPYVGPAGVTVILLVLIAKYAALEALLNQADYVALLLVPMLGRAMLLLLLLTTDYVRRNGLASALAAHQPRVASGWVVFGCAIFTLFTTDGAGGWLLMALGLLFLSLRRMMIQRIRGATGDTLGATVELSEAVGLMVLAAAA